MKYMYMYIGDFLRPPYGTWHQMQWCQIQSLKFDLGNKERIIERISKSLLHWDSSCDISKVFMAAYAL